MTFKEFVKKQRAVRGVRGMLVVDVRHDKRFPDTDDWEVLRDYIVERSDPDSVGEMLVALRKLWREHQGPDVCRMLDIVHRDRTIRPENLLPRG